MHPGARRQRTLPRACLHPPGGARTPARRLISWGPPAIRPTRAHPQAHCSTEAPANTARRLGRGSMTSPATHFWGEVPPHWAALRWIAAALPTTYAKRPPLRLLLTERPRRRWRRLVPLSMSSLGRRVGRHQPHSPRRRTEAWRLQVRLSRLGRLGLCLRPTPRPSLTARPPRRWRWLAPLGMSSLGCRVGRPQPRSPRRRAEAWRLQVRLSRLGRLSLCLTLLLRLSLTARSRRRWR